jgi:hypothetical protein
MNKKALFKTLSSIATLYMIFFLVSCGGGGGGGGIKAPNVEALSASITSPTGTQTIYAGDFVNFQATISGGTTPYTYQWDFGGGATNSTLEDPGVIIFNSIGNYTVNLMVTDKNGTKASSSVIINVGNVGNIPTNISGIISTNTTWTKVKSPYILTGNVQIPYGVTVTVEPGAIIKGDSSIGTMPWLYVYGTLNAVGSSSDKIHFQNMYIMSSNVGSVPVFTEPSRVNMAYAEILNLAVLSFDGVGAFSIRDSLLEGTSIEFLLNGSTEDCYFERNIIINSSDILLSLLDNSKYYIRNNVFYNAEITALNPPPNLFLEYNSFIITGTGYAIKLEGGSNINGANNYWNTTNTSTIDSMIYDSNDNLNYPTLNYKPFLTSPDPNTPDITPHI